MLRKPSAVAALLFSVSTGVLAASTADLNVTGTITPASCTPTFSNGSVVDYGDIPASQFAGLAQAQLEVKALDFSITCAAPTIIGIAARDGTPGSVAGVSEYEGFYRRVGPGPTNLVGMGRTIDNKRIGAGAILIDEFSFTNNGSPVDTISYWKSTNSPWEPSTYGWLGPSFVHAFASPGSLNPMAVTSLSGRLGFSPVLSISRPDSDGLTFDDEINFEANVVVDVLYL